MKAKFMLLITAVLMALATSPSWAAKPRTGNAPYPENAGSTTVDTLNWSDQGNFSLIDTITSTIKDTTTNEIDISGCSRVSLWVILGSLTTGYQATTITPQVSPDLGTWLSFATTFSAKKATTGSDTLVAILYDRDYAIDTLAARDVLLNMKLPVGRDFRLMKAAKYLRLIQAPAGPDSATVKAIVRREWPSVGGH